MTALILDGRTVAAEDKQILKEKIDAFIQKYHRAPGLAVILVGQDPASEIYVNRKKSACNEVGINSLYYHFPSSLSQEELLNTIDALNERSDVDGILVQLPLPEHIDSQAIINRINPAKDVDGFHPLNVGRLTLRQSCLSSCTPMGIMRLMKAYDISPSGKHAVIVGTSNIVGRPMALELLAANATVTLCHRLTQGLEKFVRMADILVVAIGNPSVIKAEWLNSNQTVIDIGINRLENNTICGDVPFDAAKEIVQAITPVPGGVGPMTIISLLENCLTAALSLQKDYRSKSSQSNSSS